MKIKQNLFITDPEDFMDGVYTTCFTLFQNDGARHWINLGEIEIDVDVPREDVAGSMVDALDAEAERLKAETSQKLQEIAAKRSELLAITFDANTEGK